MKKPRKLPQATIERICREAAGELIKVEAGAGFIANTNDFVNDYRKGVDYSAVRRGGSEGSSVEMAALDRSVDDIGESLLEFAIALENVGIWARRMNEWRVKVETHWTKEARDAAEFIARQSADPAASGRCKVCDRVVSGSRIDRIKGGRCEACHKYHNRNRKERPKHLWGGDSLDDTCQTIRTHLGTDYSCSLAWGHEGDCQFPIPAGDMGDATALAG